jgi:hypothetical protein
LSLLWHGGEILGICRGYGLQREKHKSVVERLGPGFLVLVGFGGYSVEIHGFEKNVFLSCVGSSFPFFSFLQNYFLLQRWWGWGICAGADGTVCGSVGECKEEGGICCAIYGTGGVSSCGSVYWTNGWGSGQESCSMAKERRGMGEEEEEEKKTMVTTTTTTKKGSGRGRNQRAKDIMNESNPWCLISPAWFLPPFLPPISISVRLFVTLSLFPLLSFSCFSSFFTCVLCALSLRRGRVKA